MPVAVIPEASPSERARVATSVDSLVSEPSGDTSPTTMMRPIR